MKNQLLIILGILLISSCTPKFNFNTAYRFSKTHYTNQEIPLKDIPIIASTETADYLLPQPSFYNNTENSTHLLNPIENELDKKALTKEPIKNLTKEEKKTIRKNLKSKLKQAKSMLKKDTTSQQNTTPDASKNWAAIAGFSTAMLALLGLLVPGLILLAIPGLIFSIIGIKSEKRTLAILGIVFNSIPILLLMLALIFLLLFFNGW